MHYDPEGRVRILRDGFEKHRAWHYEQLRKFKGSPEERKAFLSKLGEELLARFKKQLEE